MHLPTARPSIQIMDIPTLADVRMNQIQGEEEHVAKR